jgi:hypothetical protein
LSISHIEGPDGDLGQFWNHNALAIGNSEEVQKALLSCHCKPRITPIVAEIKIISIPFKKVEGLDPPHDRDNDRVNISGDDIKKGGKCK